MTEYRRTTTPNPPVLRKRGAKFYVVVIDGATEIEAEIGPWFLEQLFTRMLLPLLKEKDPK